ncbi:MAG: CapA family protein [Candidatus Doudnabacteria bacterium]
MTKKSSTEPIRLPSQTQTNGKAKGLTIPPSSNLKPTTLFLAGDIMLSRNVGKKMSEAKDFSLPFKNVADAIKNADIAFANLESPFNDSGAHFIDRSLVFNADPQTVAGLTDAGFDVLSTANNHTLDQGTKGLQYTYNFLKQNYIEPIGTTASCHDGVIITKNDTKFGFLAYSYAAHNDGGKKPEPQVCDANNSARVAEDAEQLRPNVDFLIVSMHMGIEYTRKPTLAQTNFAHTAIDSGADFVVGAHPHWVQTPEQYKGKWIFYSLGNFVFDQMWSQETREGLTLKLSVEDKKLTKIELRPVIIDDFCCVRSANPDEASAILTKVHPHTNTNVIFDNDNISDDWKDVIYPK